ncbi:CRTAC1 family protein [Tenacibaculum agarivorans]|uniref:CRTAC1 family protein n=1 Tax=Tenacibaculum agarivorans TaxID=1908389 RepID=UPI00094BA803|nr:CRTAC1 family protein [Tenacibaculum agarivorans]
MKNKLFLLTLILALSFKSVLSQQTQTPIFSEVTQKVGLITEYNWKYGGPTIADLNQDGKYDLLLGNHDNTPVQLFWGGKENVFTEQKNIFPRADLHGMSAGDYDKDGDLDIVLSLGGGNGLTPQPQRLLRNDNGTFKDVTEEAGLSKMGARGRSVRWIDLDNDGDLDFLQINAAQMVHEDIPRNILFENKGDGTFAYKPSPIFEAIDAERLLITDFNNDDQLDIITFSPYSPIEFWAGNNDFTFTNKSDTWLPKELQKTNSVMTVAEFDFDNDGNLDYYLARGKSTYQMANNAVNFDENKKRLDFRDEGNKSHDRITFFASGDINLLEFFRFPRGPKKPLIPLFIGRNKIEYKMPVEVQTVTQEEAKGFPKELDKSGWYLGYKGNGEWRLEWLLKTNLAWGIRGSITGVNKIKTDWERQNLGVEDILLKNQGDHFVNATELLPKESGDNNPGIIPGDFNNDGFTDLFIYRYGKLKQREPDVLLTNHNGQSFKAALNHGATPKELRDFHGDMGAAFDYNLDGRLDILSGDEDNGSWHLYENKIENINNYILITVGNTKDNIDAYGAKVTVITKYGKQHKLIGSGSASHAQSFLNTVHFGLGKTQKIEEIKIQWRNGGTKTFKNVKVNQNLKVFE